jgi:hypothetical protein
MPGLWTPATAQQTTAAPGIQDNSFLVEEAYNQERGMVQHINTFFCKDTTNTLIYTFTQEWPLPGNPRNQVSYTLVGAHAARIRLGCGLGDVIPELSVQLWERANPQLPRA